MGQARGGGMCTGAGERLARRGLFIWSPRASVRMRASRTACLMGGARANDGAG